MKLSEIIYNCNTRSLTVEETARVIEEMDSITCTCCCKSVTQAIANAIFKPVYRMLPIADWDNDVWPFQTALHAKNIKGRDVYINQAGFEREIDAIDWVERQNERLGNIFKKVG